MEYRIIAYIVIGILALYIAFRIAGQMAINKLIREEYEHVLKNDEYKIKGKFQ